MSEDGEQDVGEQELEAMQLGGMMAQKKKGNVLPVWGNEKTMNLNNMILTNILQSPYYKVQLAEFKTYHEVVDQIYYHVNHLEPWERGSRKTSGQIGMCGGVRGVGAGGIVSSAFCLLYKLFTIKLTRKQLHGLINHEDSPYLRGVGFLYIRFCQPPPDLWEMFEPYLDDAEEVDPKAGGGDPQTVGQLVRHFLTRLDWYGTLFPRIPVPVQKQIEAKLKERRIQQQNERLPQARQEERRSEPIKRESPQGAGDKSTRRRSRSPVRRREEAPGARNSSPDRGLKREAKQEDRHRDSSRRDERRRSPPDRRDRRRDSPLRRSPPRRDYGRSNGGESSSSHGQRTDRRREEDIPSGKSKSDDFADLLEREKERQRYAKIEEGATVKRDNNGHDRSKVKREHRSRSASSSDSDKSSDSSSTMKRKGKEESQKKHKHKKHKSSHRDGVDRDRGSNRRDSRERSEKHHSRKRSPIRES